MNKTKKQFYKELNEIINEININEKLYKKTFSLNARYCNKITEQEKKTLKKIQEFIKNALKQKKYLIKIKRKEVENNALR